MGLRPQSDDGMVVGSHIFVMLALALAAGLAVPCAAAHRAPVCHPTEWRTDYACAMEEARHSGRPAVIYFAVQWDATSTEAFQVLRRDPQLVRALHSFMRIRLEEPDLGVAYARFRVNELPSLAVVDPDGCRVGVIVVDPESNAWVPPLLTACGEAMRRAICVLDPPRHLKATHSQVAARAAPPPMPPPPPPAFWRHSDDREHGPAAPVRRRAGLTFGPRVGARGPELLRVVRERVRGVRREPPPPPEE
jgi:hypothetical protein